MNLEYSVLDGNLVSKICPETEVEPDVKKMIDTTNDMISQMSEIIHLHNMGINIFSDDEGNKVVYADVIYSACSGIGEMISCIKQHNSVSDNQRLIHQLDSKYALIKHMISFSML